MPRTFNSDLRERSARLGGACLALSMLGSAVQAAPTTLCHPDEKVWFSCRIGPEQTVSLCGTTNTLQYRFGTAQHLALQFPAAASQGYSAFRWAHHTRLQADRTEVSFRHRGVDYTLFDYTEGGRRQAGVEVASTRQLHCTDAPRGRLALLKEKLPCDADSALNLGQCPDSAP